MTRRKASQSFDETRRRALQDSELAAVYLNECLIDGNMELFTEALRYVAEARAGSMTGLAEETELGRQTLYRTLSKDGNPRLDTLNKILHAAGLTLAVAPEPSH